MSIKNLAISRMAKQLENLGCEFKIITDDGTEFGTLEIAEHKPAKREYRKYVNATNYKELLSNLKPGESVFVPAGTAPLDGVQSVCSSRMIQLYGKGSCMTAQDTTRNGIECLRLE